MPDSSNFDRLSDEFIQYGSGRRMQKTIIGAAIGAVVGFAISIAIHFGMDFQLLRFEYRMPSFIVVMCSSAIVGAIAGAVEELKQGRKP